MIFDFGFYSSILLIFFVHLVVFSVLFFIRYKTQEQTSSFWLSILLFFLALYIAPWMVGFAGWYDNQPYRDILFYVPFQHLFCIGPVTLFYVQSLLNPLFRVRGKQRLHFLPALLYTIFSLLMFVYDKLFAGQYVFLADQLDPDFDTWYQVTGFCSMLLYFVCSIIYYSRYKKIIVQLLSNAGDASFNWIKTFLLAFLIILLARLTLAIGGLLFDVQYAGTWWYFWSISIVGYYISIAGYANAVRAPILFRTSIFHSSNEIHFLSGKERVSLPAAETKFISLPNAIDPTVADDVLQKEWREQIDEIFMRDRLFEQPELTLMDLAKKLGTNISIASRMVNKGFGMNFNDMVNQYRVNYVIERLKAGEHLRQTLLSIAFEAGFNSKTTFNRAFKKQTGISPQSYTRQFVFQP